MRRPSSRSRVSSGPRLTDRAQLKPALGGDAAIRLQVFPDLAGQGLPGLLGPLADELGGDRVVGLAEETAVGAGAGDFAHALAAERPGEHQVARHRRRLRGLPRLAPSLDVVDHRADERPVVGVARVNLHREVDSRIAGRRERDPVDRVGMRDRADQRDLVHHLGQPGQALADIQTRHARRDAAQLAPDFDGCVGLGIERLELAGRAVHEKQDARLRLAEPRKTGARNGGLALGRCLHSRQSGAQEAERADLKQLAPRQPVAEALRSAQDAQHRFPFRNSATIATDDSHQARRHTVEL